MKTFIFMNEQLHKKKPKHGVISVQVENHPTLYVNYVHITGDCIVRYDPEGCPDIKTHLVKAWIEID